MTTPTRRTTSPPFLSWAIINRNSEDTIEAMLRSLRERTPDAEICIVDTCSRDSSPEIAKRYADVFVEWRGPRGTWDQEMPWFDDAAAARQHAFELASGRWVGWIDTDDVLPGPEEVERLLKLNGRFRPAVGAVVEGAEADKGVISLEDSIRLLEEKVPHADCIWSPYLYQRDEHDQAVVWQTRERFVRWDPKKWRWAEKAHEILVPISHIPPKVEFPHLLFVHEKKFDGNAISYGMSRHFAVLHGQYLNTAERTTRRCLYLAAYAPTLAPERELEFIKAAHAASTTPNDRYQSLIALGRYYGNRGLALDALEAFSAATHLRPDLPDAWLVGAEFWSSGEDPIRAIEWLRKGIACEPGRVETYVTPRHQSVRYPTLLATQLSKVAKMQSQGGFAQNAISLWNEATQIMVKVRDGDTIGMDRQEAHALALRLQNFEFAEMQAVGIKSLADFLFNNDESAKVLDLIDVVPWNLKDHPFVIALQRKTRPLYDHLTDPVEYRRWYSSDMETGLIKSPEHWLTVEGAVERVGWAAKWINKNCPTAKVVDVGCLDGIVGIPLLKLCPKITYVGIDIYAKSTASFKERAEKAGLSDRIQLYTVPSIEEYDGPRGDVALWFEVIEHVPDMEEALGTILFRCLLPGGHLLLTTPWGSFDAGHPPPKTHHGEDRGIRGHVRALTPREVVEVLEDSGTRTAELILSEGKDPHWLGDELYAIAKEGEEPSKAVSFAVAGALWDWNASTVENEGMGASEKSIVQIGKALAKADHLVDVYGPVPSPEVRDSVGYWPKEQIRFWKEGTIVVSRAPQHAREIDNAIHGGFAGPAANARKVLWLQDASYPDLNEETAALYSHIVVVSEWHKLAMNARHGVPLDRMTVIYNPIVKAEWKALGPAPERDPAKFVYFSSPDRGLIKLLELWPKIRQAIPNATLEIFYGWRGCARLGNSGQAAWTQRFESMRRDFERLRWQPGVYDRGMIPPSVLFNTLRSAGVWAYPTSFEETCCTAVLEARAAGMVPVCPPLAALAETAHSSMSFFVPKIDEKNFEEEFIEACVEATQASERVRTAISEEVFKDFEIASALVKWKEIL